MYSCVNHKLQWGHEDLVQMYPNQNSTQYHTMIKFWKWKEETVVSSTTDDILLFWYAHQILMHTSFALWYLFTNGKMPFYFHKHVSL